MIDFAVIYSIFLYFQFLVAPLLTAFGYLCYVVRLSIPYFFVYILICLFFNFTTYQKNSTIKLLKYTIDINAVKKSKIYIYLREYNYVLIILFNLLLLSIIYYSYMNNKYFYLLFIFLFYLLVLIIIKIKHFLLKNVTWRSKKANMFVNLILAILVCAYISMAMEDLYISNFKLNGFENAWKLVDNKYFIKMPSKDLNWNRIYNWSKQMSSDCYMNTVKKNLLIKSIDKTFVDAVNDQKKINNINIAAYLQKTQNEDEMLSKFTNAFYKKFKKIFLMQTKMKTSHFIPTSEVNERKKIFNWLINTYHIIDMSKFYMDTEAVNAESIAYNNYLELLNKKFNNITTKKVFLITLNKNFSNFRSLGFFAEFNESFKNNYEKFLNSDKSIIKNLKNFNTLDFEYYNSNLDFDFSQFKNEIYILFKENKMALLSKKFKNLNTIKTFKFLFKEDVLTDSNFKTDIQPKAKVLMIPDLKKLQYWKTFKLNYKELLYSRSKGLKKIELKKSIIDSWENEWLNKNKFKMVQNNVNNLDELYIIVDDDTAYCLSDLTNLKQVEDLEFDYPIEEYDGISEFIDYYLENIKLRSKVAHLYSINKLTKANNLDKAILELQNPRKHVPHFSNIYHEMMMQNSNNFFQYVLENSTFFRNSMTIFRACLPFDLWFSLMNKLLNLKVDSLYLYNLKDYTNYCKSDFTDDLQFNFSLAFKIMQYKYDVTSLQSIPDLEGLPGTFYEYTVQYKYQMDKFFWYEEQEALIDWIYEISYYSLVNIMDAINNTDYKEDTFMYNMLNEQKFNKKFKWVDDFYGTRRLISEIENNQNNQNNQLINLIYKQFNELENLEKFNNDHQYYLLNTKKKNNDYLNKLFDFSEVITIEEFKLKMAKDINFLNLWPNYIKSMLIQKAQLIIKDFNDMRHEEFHFDFFDTLSDIQREKFLDKDLDRSFFEECKQIEKLKDEDICPWNDDQLYDIDDHADEVFLYEEIEFLDNFEYLMMFEYETLLANEELYDKLMTLNDNIDTYHQKLVFKYGIELNKAYVNVIQNLINEMEFKHQLLLDNNNDIVNEKINEMKLDLIELARQELNLITMKELPIFDWSTYSFIQENIDILIKQDYPLYVEKMKILNQSLNKEIFKYNVKVKNLKLYNEQFIQHSKQLNPVTKRFIEKNWDDYNYHSNKNDKVMRDWYKKKK